MEKEYILEGLGCTHCAQKIEEKIGKLEGIEAVNINFALAQMSIEFKEKAIPDKLFIEIKEIVRSIEPHIMIKEKAFSDLKAIEKKIPWNKILEICIGAILLGAGILLNLTEVQEIVIFLIAYLVIGREIIFKALRNIFKGEFFDENFLMTIATLGAIAVKEYPEAVAVMLFYQVGEALQEMAVNKSRKSISSLMEIRSEFVNKIIDGKQIRISAENVRVGEEIIIKPGERVPLDGVIIDGSSMVDTSALTGEATPRRVKEGEEILSGFINQTGLLKVKVNRELQESTASRIISLVENAAARKAPTENFITKFAKVYTPLVVLAAVSIALLPPLVSQGAQFNQWFYRALIFLVISCPCALVVSIPLGFFGGIGSAARKGILVKGGNYLEGLNQASIVVFDKTGTLTKGVFQVKEIEVCNGFTKEEVLKYAAFAEENSGHPIAKSILEAWGKPVNLEIIENFEEITSYGVKAKVAGREIIAGKYDLLKREGISKLKKPNELVKGTIVYVAVDGIFAGFIAIADEIKADSLETVKQLRQMGVKKLVMLTGDNMEVAKETSQKLGLDEVYSHLLPQEKVAKLEVLLNEKGPQEKLVFLGDGINDAPVLARADIGVAMGALGSDAAIEAADMVLMNDEPSSLVTAMKIAKRTKLIVWQNIILAFSVKLFVLLLGTVGLATMWGAVFADVGVALLAVLNTMRIITFNNY